MTNEKTRGFHLSVTQDLWITLGQKLPDKDFVEEFAADASGRVRLAANQAVEIGYPALTPTCGASRNAAPPFEIAAGRIDEVILLYSEPVTIQVRVSDLSGTPASTMVCVGLGSGAVAGDGAGG